MMTAEQNRRLHALDDVRAGLAAIIRCLKKQIAVEGVGDLSEGFSALVYEPAHQVLLGVESSRAPEVNIPTPW
jgi:hypothetical protein